MEVSKYLRDYSRTIEGKQQMIIAAFARALEVIPRQLCDNAGFDATELLNKLRQKHAQGKRNLLNNFSIYIFILFKIGQIWYGIDMESESIANNYEKFVWEPALVKVNAISSASEAACLILSVDETVRNKPAEAPDAGQPGRGRGRGGPRR